jgi:hypothetical protein
MRNTNRPALPCPSQEMQVWGWQSGFSDVGQSSGLLLECFSHAENGKAWQLTFYFGVILYLPESCQARTNSSLTRFLLLLAFYISIVHLSKRRSQCWYVLHHTQLLCRLHSFSIRIIFFFLIREPNQDITLHYRHVSLVSSGLWQFFSLSFDSEYWLGILLTVSHSHWVSHDEVGGMGLVKGTTGWHAFPWHLIRGHVLPTWLIAG